VQEVFLSGIVRLVLIRHTRTVLSRDALLRQESRSSTESCANKCLTILMEASALDSFNPATRRIMECLSPDLT